MSMLLVDRLDEKSFYKSNELQWLRLSTAQFRTTSYTDSYQYQSQIFI